MWLTIIPKTKFAQFFIFSFIFVRVLFFAEVPALGSTNCVNPNDSSVPLCPVNELLSEQFPIAVVTVSAKAPIFAADYIERVFEAQSESLPLVYLTGTQENLDLIKRYLRARVNTTPGKAERWIQQLRLSGPSDFPWHQDYFESFHNPRTGMPTLRRIDADARVPSDLFQNVSQQMLQDCKGIEIGEELRSPTQVSGMKGGNLEAADDLCIIGRDSFPSDREFLDYSKNVCGRGKFIRAPTEFLAVGHVDEIYKTIPIPGKSPPCNFAIAIASPERGLRILQENPSSQAFSRSFVEEDTKNENMGLRMICGYFDLQYNYRRQVQPNRGRTFLQILLSDYAFAANPPSLETANEQTRETRSCLSMTNGELYQIISSNPELRNLNQEIQVNMNLFKEELIEHFKQKCQGNAPPVIEIPQIFDGAENFSTSRALSIFPNLSNGEYVNGTYIMPAAVNSEYQKDFQSQLQALGIATPVIDTTDLHAARGNLHCATHAIRYCRPRGAQ
jgi:hypothetical protein